MTPHRNKYNFFTEFFRFFDLLYHSIVRGVRQSNVNPVTGLLRDILQSLLIVAFFLFLTTFLGSKGSAIRGNEMLFVMSGVFLFLVHIKAIREIQSTKGPLNKMNLHTHVTSVLNLLASTFATLYIQIISFFVILYFTHVLIEPVVIYYPPGVALGFFAAWFSGLAIGNLFLSLNIFFPKAMSTITMLYIRLNMIFSGKIVLASTIPAFMYPMFAWNPLFHVIDHARSAAFINYTARRTDITYAFWVSFAILVISFMIDHWARKYASESWAARQ